MDFSVLILTIGIPGAGKSTWVQEYVKKYPNGTFVISTDQIRKDLTGIEQCVDPSQNSMMHVEARKRAKSIIDNRKTLSKKLGTWPVIIIDSRNVSVEEWIEYKRLGSTIMMAKVFDVPPEEAIKRISQRERKVPFEVLQTNWEILERNRKYMSKIFNRFL